MPRKSNPTWRIQKLLRDYRNKLKLAEDWGEVDKALIYGRIIQDLEWAAGE